MATADAKKPVLLGIGNPLLDISNEVNQEFLDKYGFKLNDAILCEKPETFKCYAELKEMKDTVFIAGGATQNSIRVAQWMLQSKKDSSHMIGCVGADSDALTLANAAGKDGVKTHYLMYKTEPTGTCAVAVVAKERSLCANLAAANKYQHSHLVSEEISKIYKTATHIYSAGFFLTVSPESVNFLGEHCRANGKTFCMNLSAIFIVQFFGDKLKKALENCDILFGNESEAAAWGEAEKLEDKSIEAIAKNLAAYGNGKRTVVITQGSGDTIVVADGVLTAYPTPPLKEESIVDSNGAGDAFVGGFLAALMSDAPMADCVKAGQYSAGVILQVSGCVLTGEPEIKY